jgi:hypothetical protein
VSAQHLLLYLGVAAAIVWADFNHDRTDLEAFD